MMEQVRPHARNRKRYNLYRCRGYLMVGSIYLLWLFFRDAAAKPTTDSLTETEEQHFAEVNGEQATSSFQSSGPIRGIHYHFDQKMEPFMKLHKLNSTDENSNTVTCNDGSPIGYYKRLNNHSKSWIIYLQGGGYCGGEEGCQHRWRHSPHLMSSNYWPKLKSVDGILSSEPKDNPYLWNANHIYVPYCSSDSWTGLQEARADRSPSFTFMGSRIIEKVLDSLFDDLPRHSSLFESKFILLAGDSAGATGVILNLDKVNRLIQQRINSSSSPCTPGAPTNCDLSGRQAPVVRGLADSGWFLDNEPYDHVSSLTQDWPPLYSEESNEVDCDRQRCTPVQSIKQAMSYWNGQVPAACASRQANEPWRCYFGYRAYQSLKTPLFVVQWLYDEAQLMLDNIIRPGTTGQWNYVNSLITKQIWNQININGFKLPQILNSWEEELLINQPTLRVLDQEDDILATKKVSKDNQPAAVLDQHPPLALDEPKLQQTVPPINLNFELRTAPSRSYSAHNGNSQSTYHINSRPKSRKKRRNNPTSLSSVSSNRVQINTNRLSRSASVLDYATPVLSNNVPEVLLSSSVSKQQEGVDKFRLIDACGWPQCNRDCPYLEQDLNMRSTIPY